MPYVGSYIWKLRQSVGDMRIVSPTADVVCVNSKNEILMVHNTDFDLWTFPAGNVEEGLSWGESAAQEALEEGRLVIDPNDLVPFATISGSGYIYQYKDGSVQPFTLAFATNKFTERVDAALDESEISETKWVTLEEAEKLPKALSACHILPAYKNWLKTKEFQQITIK